MKQTILVFALLLATSVAIGAQDSSQSGPYQGTSNPPPDDQIVTQKPSPSQPAYGQSANSQYPSNAQAQSGDPAAYSVGTRPTSVDPSLNFPSPAGDDGMVQIAPDATYPARSAYASQPTYSAQPALSSRPYGNDPDGDIVHPVQRPGELGEGTTIRARLLERLSTSTSQSGDTFRTRVASDVMQGGQILIPAGSEVDGFVVRVSTGGIGGHGSMLLHPQTVILEDGRQFKLYAQVSGTPGSRTKVGGEGVITPSSRAKKDGFEYGGSVGAGVVTGAVLGGPVGALAGGMVGAGAVTVHLLMDHPQATLETGTVLVFTLTEPLNLIASNPYNGN